MGKIFIVLLFVLFFCNYGFSQGTQLQKIDSVKNLVVERFNKKDINGLYALTGAEFRRVLEADLFASVCESNLFPLGNISDVKFENYTTGIGTYKTSFPGTDLLLLLGLDSLNKIETFLFQPYVAEINTAPKKTATSNALVTLQDKKVNEIIEPYVNKKETVGVSIAILKDDRAYYYNYGETARGNDKLPDSNTIYEIGSISKTFTSILLAALTREGKVSLNDPINKYLPDSIGKLEYEGVPITIKTLANHSSGLPRIPSNISLVGTDALNPYKKYNASLLFAFLKNFKPYQKPGTQYQYSNLGVGLLGTIIEKITNKKYNDLVIEKICTPLQMNHTSQFFKKGDSALIARGFNENGNLSSFWDFDALAGAGGIRSTASDLLKYGKANIKVSQKDLNDVIQFTHRVTYTQKDINTKVGLGWHIINPGIDELLFHNGGTGGFRSYLAINPKKKIVVVMLSNTAIGMEMEGNALMKWLEVH